MDLLEQFGTQIHWILASSIILARLLANTEGLRCYCIVWELVMEALYHTIVEEELAPALLEQRIPKKTIFSAVFIYNLLARHGNAYLYHILLAPFISAILQYDLSTASCC